MFVFFFFSSRRRHTRYWRDWSSDVCSSDLGVLRAPAEVAVDPVRVMHALAVRRAHPERPTGDDVSYGRARLALRVVQTDEIAPAEHHLRRSSYKDTDGKVAR